MKRNEFIKKLERMAKQLMTEVDTDEVTDSAREHAYNFIWDAVEYLELNEDD